MSIVSIRLPDKLLDEVDDSAHSLHLPRATYIRKAIEQMNKKVLLQQRKKQLTHASLAVRKDSMRVNKDFSDIEHDPEP